ncbi:Hypothetical protein PENO1_104650 [Penicillium occitanis (nom. inval.)]|nr:Hypothetical protein PENO1_104650 [Penicillium occitanis (nom. inval.)]PCG89787.1 hypothetical protein PENOC_105020 [Penicillium occitanis (nom. inval.)]
MDQLSEDQKPELHEVADLMLEIYQTLAKMRYIDASEIVQGPHDLTETLSHYDDGETILGLDPAIKYLYTILPYVMNTKALGWEDGKYQGANGGRSHQIWLLSVEDWKCKDLALEGVETPGWDVPTTTFGGLRHRFDYFPSRLAGDVLRDIVQWYRELKVLAGGGENDDIDWTHYRKDLDLKELYRKRGWPDNFDGDAFEVDMARSYAAHSAKESAQQPLKDLQWCQEVKANVEKHLLEQKKAVGVATNKGDEWKQLKGYVPTVYAKKKRIFLFGKSSFSDKHTKSSNMGFYSERNESKMRWKAIDVTGTMLEQRFNTQGGKKQSIAGRSHSPKLMLTDYVLEGHFNQPQGLIRIGRLL